MGMLGLFEEDCVCGFVGCLSQLAPWGPPLPTAAVGATLTRSREYLHPEVFDIRPATGDRTLKQKKARRLMAMRAFEVWVRGQDLNL
jgi:hypothetical protein